MNGEANVNCAHVGVDRGEKQEAAMAQYEHEDMFILTRASTLENPKFAQGAFRACI